jgi:hypothetical protein
MAAYLSTALSVLHVVAIFWCEQVLQIIPENNNSLGTYRHTQHKCAPGDLPRMVRVCVLHIGVHRCCR